MQYLPRRVDLFNLLNGVICIYKPPDIHLQKLTSHIKRVLSDEFNALPREPELLRTIVQRNAFDASIVVNTIPDIVDSDYVLGRRYFPSDFVLYPLHPLHEMASGIQIYGIGEDGVYKDAFNIENSSWLKTYHVTCMMGRASTTGTVTGSTLMRSSWRHVTRHKLDSVLTALQASFNSSTLLHAGLRPNSLSAYLALARRTSAEDLRPCHSTHISAAPDLMCKERLLSPWERPLPHEIHNPKTFDQELYPHKQIEDVDKRRQFAPYVNSLSCVEFTPPFFTIEVQVFHETMEFFRNFVANLGPKLRTCTLMSKLRRVKYGPLNINHTLLYKQIKVPIDLYEMFVKYLNNELNMMNISDDEDDDETSFWNKFMTYYIANRFGEHCIYENLYLCTKLCGDFRNTDRLAIADR